MKLSKEEASQLRNIINTAAMAGIDGIVFQDKSIRVASGLKGGSCAIIARTGVPALEQKMGITRIPIFKKRLELLADAPNLEINTKESDRGEVTLIDISAGKAKTNYRCTASALIRAPGGVDDGGVFGSIVMSKDELNLLISGIRTMGAPRVVLILSPSGAATFEATDGNDKFTVELEAPVERDEDNSNSSVFYYDSNIFSSLLKASIGNDDSISVAVGISGTIQFNLNNCEMSIFAQVDGE